MLLMVWHLTKKYLCSNWHATKKRCSLDLDMQHGHGRAVWTKHAACWSSCPCCMSMFMLHVNDHAACPCSCCMSMTMLHVHAHAASRFLCFMSMSMLHVHVLAACATTGTCYFVNLHVHVYAACPCPCPSSCWYPWCMSMSTLYIQVHSTDMDMQHELGCVAWSRTCSMDMDLLWVLVHAACPCLCCMSMSMLHSIFMIMLHAHVNSACSSARSTWTCIIDMDRQHSLGHAA
jgi:hypothetical protein